MILSIESSCDDSSLAITEIKTKKVIFHKKISQELEHSVYGGVVPELAARLHAEALPKILKEAKEFLPQLRYVCATTHPGLSVSLVEGVTMAKALSMALNIPFIGVDHLLGHIYSLFIEKDEKLPLIVLLISGGHTNIFEIKAYNEHTLIAKSMDDSFGESFDKVSKMMGFGYPGGPIVEKLAEEVQSSNCKFTVPLAGRKDIAFSFSGLKNQVRLSIEKQEFSFEEIAYTFQQTATKHLLKEVKKVFVQNGTKDFAIVGGASANQYVRDEFEKLCNEFDKTLLTPKMEYCSDNAVMIGRYAIEKILKDTN